MNLPADPRKSRSAVAIKSKRGLRTHYSDFLPDAQALAESETVPMARMLIFVVAAMFTAFMVWAAIAKVEQVASAPGVVRPAGKVKIINHPIGGRVAKLFVAEGNEVAMGQVLLELDPEVIRQEIVKLTNEWQSNSVEVSRLEAEASGRPPAFDLKVAQQRPDLVETHRQLYQARRQSLESIRAAAGRVVEQRASNVTLQGGRLKQQKRSYALLKEQEGAIEKLAKKGYFPRLRYLSIKREVSELAGQIAETRQNLGAAKSALAEARNKRANVDEEWRSEVLARLAKASSKRDAARSSLKQGQSQLRNLKIRAPTAGIVKDLKITGPGHAIAPNDAFLKIVPSGAQLIVETRVSNADIGYISEGQKATVKVRTYDFIRHGALTGVVEKIAADATENTETGQFWFSVTVRTDRAYLGSRPGDLPVNPGMEADVDLLIGERTILSYLTDRLQRAKDESFRER